MKCQKERMTSHQLLQISVLNEMSLGEDVQSPVTPNLSLKWNVNPINPILVTSGHIGNSWSPWKRVQLLLLLIWLRIGVTGLDNWSEWVPLPVISVTPFTPVTSHSGYQSLRLPVTPATSHSGYSWVSFFCELLKGDDDQSLLLLECFLSGGSLTTKNRSNWIR